MSIMTVTTRITRQYLERKTKSDLAQMYLDLLDENVKLEAEIVRLKPHPTNPEEGGYYRDDTRILGRGDV